MGDDLVLNIIGLVVIGLFVGLAINSIHKLITDKNIDKKEMARHITICTSCILLAILAVIYGTLRLTSIRNENDNFERVTNNDTTNFQPSKNQIEQTIEKSADIKLEVEPACVTTRISSRQLVYLKGINTHWKKGITSLKILRFNDRTDCSSGVIFNVVDSTNAYFNDFTGRSAGKYMIEVTTGNEIVSVTFILENYESYVHKGDTNAGSISGYVKSEENSEPLSGADIKLCEGNIEISISSDNEGYFEINGLDVGKTYYLSIMYDKYISYDNYEIKLTENFLINVGTFMMKKK